MEKISEEALNRLYHPVGELMVHWGVMDYALHRLAFDMFKHLGEGKLSKTWPREFGARVTALEELFKRKAFKEFRADADQVFGYIRHHAKLRNMLGHGAPVKYDAAKDAVLWERIDTITKKERKLRQVAPDITHVPAEMLVRFEMLDKAAGNCGVMNRILSGLVSEVRALPVAK
jgi:hypothetical protein